MADRNILVKLIAEVDEYVTAMERATAATTGLGDALRNLGISEKDMPAAIKSVLSINGKVLAESVRAAQPGGLRNAS